MSFVDAVKNYYAKYFKFEGTASRSEYWFAYLYLLILNFIAGFIFGSVILSIVGLIHIIPSITVTVRRLHDAGKPGLYYLFIFIPVVGVFILLYFLLKPTQVEDNPYRISVSYSI